MKEFDFFVYESGQFRFYDILKYLKKNEIDHEKIPYSVKILIENQIRKSKEGKNTEVKKISDWLNNIGEEIPYYPSRVILQDFTGVPAVVDLASLRDAVSQNGGNPSVINPEIQVDLVIDHSISMDHYGDSKSLQLNMDLEFERNNERYQLLKWAQSSFQNFRIIPPGNGIIHQINLEYLSSIVSEKDDIMFPDTLIGTDSHTTMIDGLGILGWGVGGIEAEAVMLGEPLFIKIPEVIGVKLSGKASPGITSTDIVLTITELLRKENVVEKFVEFFGPGLKELSLPDRATIANMAPEYGATTGFFPVDEKTIDYLKLTGREKNSDKVKAYLEAQGMFYRPEFEPVYSKVINFDLSSVVPSLAGPSKPQERINLEDMSIRFSSVLQKLNRDKKSVKVELEGNDQTISDGTIVLAAITSCTNTSNPGVLIGAGLLAKKAVEAGLKVPPFVKTTFAPGSRAASEYLERAGLLKYLNQLGFNIAGYGCATCIGNSGPLQKVIEDTIDLNSLSVSAILSGNRNFEARIHQKIRNNYLASPPLVVAFALAGKTDIDLTSEPIGIGDKGVVYLKDIWPSFTEIDNYISKFVTSDVFTEKYENVLDGDERWKKINVSTSQLFDWNEDSTYIRKAPFFDGFHLNKSRLESIENARILLKLGDNVTTDHISPAGSIPENYPAGIYLNKRGIHKNGFNSYGSRRGNHEVMMRGTFANVRIKNHLADGKEGGYTKHNDKIIHIFDAAEMLKKENVSLIIVAGKEYGTGSSRDWAAKGTLLLGVKAVIAKSYERIHRSNLVGMGILPFQFINDDDYDFITGNETINISISENPTHEMIVKSYFDEKMIPLKLRLDTDMEIEYIRNKGILHLVLRNKL
ncbi:MAG: aconitate hydratase AcnA [Candidatus Delongbacteria bacterium]|nr:aconitate hydratase AcnA [Candidatus Delongbacteria bacterium]MBN2833588.1 aconitate hydratase AcnA [Candidatus Delongbacteria bacterium]